MADASGSETAGVSDTSAIMNRSVAPGRLKPGASVAFSKIHFKSDAARRMYQRAAAALPTFCKRWGKDLQHRVVHNLAHLAWKSKDGYMTATYVGYGNIEQCECKESAEGIPIADLTYQQYNYNLVGKTSKEALGATPKLIRTINTLEIFSWNHNKWFY